MTDYFQIFILTETTIQPTADLYTGLLTDKGPYKFSLSLCSEFWQEIDKRLSTIHVNNFNWKFDTGVEGYFYSSASKFKAQSPSGPMKVCHTF